MISRTVISLLLSLFMLVNLKAQEIKDTLTARTSDSIMAKHDTLIVTSENQNIAPSGSLMQAYAKSYWTDTKSVFVNPFHWRKGQLITAASLMVGTVALIAWGDKPIQKFFYRNENYFIDRTSYYFFSPLGNGIFSLPVAAVFYGFGAIYKNKRAKETGLKCLEAYVINAVFTTAIKQFTHRHRPYQDTPPDPHKWDGPFSWGGAYGTFGYNSFPSGHSSSIFAVATVVAMEYWDTKWVPAVSFGLAGFTALYRLAVNDHWASDVLFGSALGFAIGSMVYFNANKKLQIVPVSSTGMGATLIYHF
jgi:membrane-associated phospholipid phosphatase